MNTLVVIPARYASTRFPGKPLTVIGGKSMIRRVFEQASKCTTVKKVIVATDDARIESEVREFDGEVMMTASTHQSGTERCAEVAEKLDEEFDVIINVQGDEPFIAPEQIDLLATCFDNPDVRIATLVRQIENGEDLFSQNIVKVVVDEHRRALYFSRSPVPCLRGIPMEDWVKEHTYYKHIGIYGYRTGLLKELTSLPVNALEKAESLEQLRWLANGYPIKTAITLLETISIDTNEDLEKAMQFLSGDNS